MNSLQNLPRSFALPLKPQLRKCQEPRASVLVISQGPISCADQRISRGVIVKAISNSGSAGKMEDSDIKEEKSDVYSTTMTEAMGAVSLNLTTSNAVLTYRHELGMNYNFIRPDLIVGSCLQVPEDVDKLRSISVKTVFCLQQDPDLEYFNVDIHSIRKYAQAYDDIEHIRAEVRDFDKHDLRMRLPAVIALLYKATKRNGGVAYIHCTAGLGRAPAVALTYMYWIQGYKLSEAHNLLQSKRPSFPKLDAIKSATADILTGLKRETVTLQWAGKNCSTVEISGLDVGWGQKVPLSLDKDKGVWVLKKELPEGKYEYKYVVDGEWLCNNNEPLTTPNKEGNVNNFVQVAADDSESDNAKLRKRLTGDDPDLTEDERNKIKQCLEELA
ncbi:hypothetical protein V2J09_022837 [Rumex salicifolius]